MFTIYVLLDESVDGCVKIGTDTKWPGRYMQARCHSPGKIRVAATFQFPKLVQKSERINLDVSMKARLSRFSREVAYAGNRVVEWYNIRPEQAVSELRSMPEFADAILKRDAEPEFRTATQMNYEDWRDAHRADCRSRIFLFQVVEGPAGGVHADRLKLTGGSLYDTAYKYNFTYCPFPVLIVGGFETSLSIANNNSRITQAWTSATSRLGNGPEQQPIGWLKQGTTIQNVRDCLSEFDCHPFPLGRPKPGDARPRDSSVGQVAVGSRYPMDRVRDAYYP